jgi:hypothetical protein
MAVTQVRLTCDLYPRRRQAAGLNRLVDSLD